MGSARRTSKIADRRTHPRDATQTPGRSSPAGRSPAPRRFTSQIVALMPPHTHFVEPYAGGLTVLLSKPCEGVSEVVNDLNSDLTNFWQVLQDDALYRRFRRRVQAIPFSEIEFQNALEWLARKGRKQQVGRAVRFFIVCRQSLAGRMKDFAPLSRT